MVPKHTKLVVHVRQIGPSNHYINRGYSYYFQLILSGLILGKKDECMKL